MHISGNLEQRGKRDNEYYWMKNNRYFSKEKGLPYIGTNRERKKKNLS